jgi:DNA polymerase
MTLSQHQFECLQRMGIDVWLLRSVTAADDEKIIPEINVLDIPAESPAVKNNLHELDVLFEQVAGCTRCSLHTTRTQTVFGVGDRQADWMIIGEAPGADEDRQGEPFVGRAGRLLNAMLLAIGLQREQVFIANILKCRPPSNRDPKPEEVTACEDFLNRQIELINPKIILAVGRIAAQNLLKIDTPIGRMRGQHYEYGKTGRPVVVTYHPAYLLRSPRGKRKVWQDLQMAMRIYREIT